MLSLGMAYRVGWFDEMLQYGLEEGTLNEWLAARFAWAAARQWLGAEPHLLRCGQVPEYIRARNAGRSWRK